METDELQKAAEMLRIRRALVNEAHVRVDYVRRQLTECQHALINARESEDQAEAELLRIAKGLPKE